MFIQAFEDINHHIDAKYYYYYYHQLLRCNCGNKSFSAGGCILVVLRYRLVFVNTGGTEVVVTAMVHTMPRCSVWESWDEGSCASSYEIFVKDYYFILFF